MSLFFLVHKGIKRTFFGHVPNVHKLKYFCTYKSIAAKENEESSTLPKFTYDPKLFEGHRYEIWESKNYFKPTKSEEESFIILLPPPNVTGTLHLGHALTCTIQDVILRWKRMKGESVLWVPGIDHAGIATQAVVEKHFCRNLGLTRQDLGKEKFQKIVWEWKNEKASKIIEQLKKMGASLDWSKLIFTMDPTHSQLVTNSFIQLYNDGMIFRKNSPVNWSCALKSSVSDIEVDWISINSSTCLKVPGYDQPVVFGHLFQFAYKLCDQDDEIVVSTTRPETILGDVAVAIHPSHPSLSKFQNKYVWHPFRNEKIPIIIDDFVDTEFGTGAVKITPSHSPVDFEVGLKHNLKCITVINEEGLINKVGLNENLHGLKRFDARDEVINALKSLNLFRGAKAHSMKLPICSRSGDVIEFLLKEQWFLKCDSLVEKAVNAVKNGSLEIEPKSYKNVWFNWLENKPLKDWNLSRQLWWGHQIPMYECQCGGRRIWLASSSLEEAKSKASKSFGAPEEDIKVVQDPDVLDTWFSSGLLPLNAEICQKKKPPISLMVTGHDILFFWVARMVMLSFQLKGELPFKKILLHSLVCDGRGKKMSKSVGNVILPDDVISGLSASEMENRLESSYKMGLITGENLKKALSVRRTKFPKGIPECGADALRLTLCSGTIQNQFLNFDLDLCLSNKFFCNKICQAMNYYLKITNAYKMKRSEFDLEDIKSGKEKLNPFDRFVLSKLGNVVDRANECLDFFSFKAATDYIRYFMINDFFNFYLEGTKAILKNDSPLQYRTTVSVFFHCMETSLRLLSPFMPFLTEHLYDMLPSFEGFDKCESVTIARYPNSADWSEFRDVELENRFWKISCLLSSVRKTKEWYNIKREKPKVFIKCSDELAGLLFGEMKSAFSQMARVEDLIQVDSLERTNVIQLEVNDDIIAFLKHKFDKAALLNILGPAIEKESKLNQDLDNLVKITEKPEWEDLFPSEKNFYTKKINSLNLELEKIKNFKFTIENCGVQ